MQQIVASSALQPAQRRRQTRPELKYLKAVRPQQFMRDSIVHREVASPGSHQPTRRPKLVVKGNGVSPNGRVSQQPRVRTTPPDTDRCERSDERVKGEPVQPLPQ